VQLFNNGDKMMRNINSKNISDANASGRGLKSALRNNYGNTSFGQQGRSMIEMLGVLAIIGVLSVGGIAGYSKAMHKYRVNKAIEQITLIAGNIRAFFAPQKNYVGVECSGHNCNATNGCTGNSCVNSNGSPITAANGCPIIKKAKILPDEMLTVNDAGKITAITNPFGGAVNLNRNSRTGNDYQAFEIMYRVDSEEACIELASHDWTTANVGVITISNAYGPSASGKANLKTPIDINTAVERCSAVFEVLRSIGHSYAEISFKFDIDINSNHWQTMINH